MFKEYRFLLSPAPGLKVGANRTKSTEGTISQVESSVLFKGLRTVSPDFNHGRVNAMNEHFSNTFF